MAKEFNKYDTQSDKWFKVFEGINAITKKVREERVCRTKKKGKLDSGSFCRYADVSKTGG